VNIPTLLELSVGATSLTIPAATQAAFDNSSGVSAGQTAVTVSSNAAWSLKLSDSDFSGTGSNTYKKPGSDLSANIDGGTYSPLGTTPVALLSAQAPVGASQHTVAYNIKYHWATDVPDTYTTTLTYTVTAP